MKKIYIAIPYTGMRESSYEQANQATADCMRLGFNPFSPITHSHPLTEFDMPGSWEFWEKIDMDWIDVCDEVWVIIPLEGVEKVHQSTGVQAEIRHAEESGKKVRAFTYVNGILTETKEQVKFYEDSRVPQA